MLLFALITKGDVSRNAFIFMSVIFVFISHQMYFNSIASPLYLFQLNFFKIQRRNSTRIFITNLLFLFFIFYYYNYFYLQNGAILNALAQLQEWVMFDV